MSRSRRVAVLAVLLLGTPLSATVAADGPQLPEAMNADKKPPAGEKMTGEKMTGEKMTGEKMTDEKMTGEKMKGGEPAAAVPSPPVTGGAKPLAAADEARIDALAARIDTLLAEAWAAQGIEPAAAASDARFLRRVSLDLVGRIPRAAEARAFLADTAPDRRRQLVERLLASREHAEYMAAVWHAALLPDVAGSTPLEPWLAGKFAAGAGYDRIARDIVLSAATKSGGEAALQQALDRKPTELAAAVSRTFLGTQIQCAECHKHPTDVWTQDDFWGFAAFFGDVKHPKTGAAVSPRVLAAPGDAPAAEGAAAGAGSTNGRQELAAWLVSPANRWFSRAAVNRLWGMLFGAGIVNPVDDLGDHNPPAHAGVLDELADFFAAGGWNHRDVLRAITRTRAYGLAGGEGRLFAAMPLEPLNAVQLYNSLATTFRARRLGPEMRQFNNVGSLTAEQFVAKFRTAPGQEREYTAGIPQAITMMNGQLFDPMRAVYDEAMLAARTDAERVEALFLATLSRPPAAAELDHCLEVLGRETDAAGRRLAFVDIHWALVNSAEFAFSP
jgi:hypothetical protein